MSISILCGDCRDVLRTLPDESVHCVVTSPPYWGLRDYGTATWEGGDAGCDHRSPTMREGRNENRAMLSGSVATNSAQLLLAARSECGKCGARRIDSQLGLEPDFNAYIAAMVEVFREVRRVLRSDGTLWLNMGDSYAQTSGRKDAANGRETEFEQRGKDRGYDPGSNFANYGKRMGEARSTVGNGLKPKDLCGIPWRVAFALQADGWWLRQDIIWSKPNPMPESVTDRCTKAHEYIFLMSKSARYYYDADAIAEAVEASTIVRNQTPRNFEYEHANSNPSGGGLRGKGGINDWKGETTRNKRSVWEIATAPFSEAHFATFPPALIEPCIKAGCPQGGTVLDPFGGAGTTGLVADRLQRNSILIELNPEYAAMAERRIFNDAPLFVEAAE